MDEILEHLPVTSTPLFGREHDVDALCEWLRRPDVRLVTITGLPGIGKTRLCIEVGRMMSADFSDGVYFVPLNTITDPELVLPAIAQAVGVREKAPGSLFENLKASLRDKRLLLILDNFEQVTAAAMTIAQLLAQTPRIKIIITSRTALHLSSEHEYSLSPLGLPELNYLPPLAELAQLPSVAMFVARAQAVKPDFQLTHSNAQVVAQVCFRLDGIPLAIELAAARTKVLPPQALLTRLTHPLTLLTNGARDAPSRHQTLQRAIEWSYGLLSPSERRLFTRMAVFPSGASIDAIEYVCDLEGNAPQIIDDLGILLDHSLLQSHEGAGGDPRFTMLVMIREFALDQLGASGEREALERRFTDYYVQLAATAEPLYQQEAKWLDLMEAEHDNLRAALQWLIDHEPLRALQLSASLWYFWLLHSHYSEGRMWLERAMGEFDQPGSADAALPDDLAALVGKALHGVGTIAYYQSDYQAARTWLDGALAIRRRLDDKQGIAATLNNLGNLAHDHSDLEAAQALYLESLEMRRALNDLSGMASALSNLGNIAHYRSDYDKAGEYYLESLALRRQTNDRVGLAIILNNLGIVALHTGNYGAAAVYYEESLVLDQENGNMQAEAAVRNNLGELAMFQGAYERADAQYAASLKLRRQLGDRWGIASVLNNAGCSALHQGDYGKAVALLEEALVLKRAIGDRWAISSSLMSLATATLLLNDIPRSAEMLQEALILSREIEDEGSIGVAIIGIASVAAAVGNFVWAARLMAKGEYLLHETGLDRAIAVGDQVELERVRTLIRSGISGDALAKAEREGLALSAEDVMAHFDEAVNPPAQAAEAQPMASENAPKDGLTVREMEVLKLIADGLSYGQIAEKLVISTRTVDAHLRSIYSKLQVRSRHEATRYAQEHRLL